MRKRFSKIIISLLIAGFFLLPVSFGFLKNQNNSGLIEINSANAQTPEPEEEKYYYITQEGGTNIGIPTSTVHGPFDTLEQCQQDKDKTVSVLSKLLKDCYKKVGGAPQVGTFGGISNEGAHDYGFKCGVSFWGLGEATIGGCFAAIFYVIWLLFSQVMHLGGLFLDFFIYYSTNDVSYRGVFVERGWSVIRDVSNLFFIIALLYVAYKVILNDTHSNPKKLIGAIIMMALLINFSLFATKVVIDASNILAKVFYNNITSKDKNGNVINNSNGEKSISVGLVQKFNPQQVIDKDTYNSKHGVAQFIFVTFVLIVLTIYCSYIFFSVGFLFVARVVSLWIAMIFSPLAFVSNAVTFDFGTMSWRKWSSDLVHNAMLAPVFVFFLYLIILFLDASGSVITYTGSTDLFQNIMSVIIPFMILAGLLKKAKDLAVEYSGEMGKTISGLGAAVTGVALGGAALTAAYAGRKTFGAVTKYAQNDNARGKDKNIIQSFSKLEGLDRVNPLKWASVIGKGIQANTAEFITGTQRDTTGTVVSRNRIGKTLINSEKDLSHKLHAEHVIGDKTSEMASKWGLGKDTKFKDLTESQQQEVKDSIDKDVISKKTYGKKFSELNDTDKEDSVKNAIRNSSLTQDHEIQYTIEKIFKDSSGQIVNRQIDTKTVAGSEAELHHANASAAMGEFVRALRKGTYDIRNLPDTVAKTKGFNKNSVALVAAVALGVRAGLKSSMSVNPGTGKGQAFDDMKNIIVNSLKNINITLPSGGGGGKGGGGHGGHDDHGGGHGGHH